MDKVLSANTMLILVYLSDDMIRLNNKENENKKNHLLIDFMHINFISWKTMIGAFVDKSFKVSPSSILSLIYIIIDMKHTFKYLI